MPTTCSFDDGVFHLRFEEGDIYLTALISRRERTVKLTGRLLKGAASWDDGAAITFERGAMELTLVRGERPHRFGGLSDACRDHLIVFLFGRYESGVERIDLNTLD